MAELNNSSNRHIVLVISSLSSGGAERVLSTMANFWVKHGNDITLITLDSVNNDFYKIDSKVKRIGLDLLRPSASMLHALSSNYYRFRVLRKLLYEENPDVIISFVDRTNVLTLLSSFKLNIPVIVSERIDPRYHSVGKIWSTLRKILYRRSSTVVVQTENVKKWIMSYLGIENVVSFPNPIEINDPKNIEKNSYINGNVIVTVGRLHHQKGHDVLIAAFSDIFSKYTDWSLVIFGEGPLRNHLEKMIKNIGLEKHIFLPGRIKNPENIIGDAKIFVFPSRYEGFPNALLEAMACGLPVISTDCNSGPSEIIRSDINGVLVPVDDVNALSITLQRLMNDADKRKELGSQALLSVKRYTLSAIMALWDNLLNEVIK